MLQLPFDRVVCINLPRRTDRKALFIKHWIDSGLIPGVTWQDGFDGWVLHDTGIIPPGHWGMQTPGFAGSWMAHQQACWDTDGHQSVLVFEDDARPAPDIERAWNALLKDVPDDWEGIWFGYDPGHKRMNHITNDCIRHFNPLNTHCYALRGALLREAQLLKPEEARMSHWDGALQKLANHHRVYAHHGVLVRQAIWDGEDDPRDNYEDLR